MTKEELLRLYNFHYNLECAGLPHGGPISMQELEAMALSAMLSTLKLAGSDSISAQNVELLIDALNEQGRKTVPVDDLAHHSSYRKEYLLFYRSQSNSPQ